MKKLIKMLVIFSLMFLNISVQTYATETTATEDIITTVNIDDSSSQIELFKIHHESDDEGIFGISDTNPITLKFIGHKFMINAYKSDDSGNINIILDGKKITTVSAFSEDMEIEVSEPFYTSNTFEEKEHTLVLQQAEEGKNFYLQSIDIIHKPITATQLTVNKEQFTLEETETTQLEVSTYPEISPAIITYASSDEAIATVNDAGLITAKKAGTATITVRADQLQKEVNITVNKQDNNMKAFMGSTDRHYKQSDYAEVLNATSTSLVPFAYQNDEIDSEIVVLAKKQDLQNVSVKFSNFTSNTNATLPNSIAKAFFLKETSVHIGRGGVFGVVPTHFPKENIPDILDTVATKNVSANSLQPVWIKLNIPTDAKQGTYKGTITIIADNALKPIEIPYEFNVLAIKQPQEHRFSMELWQYPFTTARFYGLTQDELFTEKHLNLLKQELSEYKKAGGDSITTTISENPWNSQTYDKYPSMVKWTKKADGTFTFDFTNFDKYVQLALDLGISKQIKSFSITPWNNRVEFYDEVQKKNVRDSFRTGTEEWKTVWGQFLDAYIKHLDEKGWFEIAYMAMDERPIDDMKEVISLLEKHLNKDHKRLKLSAAMNYSAQNAEVLEKVDDISIVLSHINPDDDTISNLAKQRRSKNQTTTLYTCVGEYPSSFSRSAPAESAWTIWYAESVGMDGFLRWAYDAWVKNPEATVDHWYWEGGDPFFVYPANADAKDKTPRTSPRFERLKEAKRQVEKLRFIKERVPAAAEEIDTFVKTIVRKNGVRNRYGAMESPSKEQDALIGNEVTRMNQKVYELSVKYYDLLADKITKVETDLGTATFPQGSVNPIVTIEKVDTINTDKLLTNDKATLDTITDKLIYDITVQNITGPISLDLKYDTTKNVTGVYHIKHNNELETINNYTVKDGFVSFEATDFSPYIIAYKVEKPNTEKPNVTATEMTKKEENKQPTISKDTNSTTKPTNTKKPVETNNENNIIFVIMSLLSIVVFIRIKKH